MKIENSEKENKKTHVQGIVKNICIGTFSASATCVWPENVHCQVSEYAKSTIKSLLQYIICLITIDLMQGDWQIPYAGGLAIIASTLNGILVTGSGSTHAGSKENTISRN